jgi:glycosyltransferase involved in cell wall biosynthesis
MLKEKFDIIMLREDYPIMCHLAFIASEITNTPTTLTTERSYYPKGLKGLSLKLFDLTINKILRNGIDVYFAHCNAAKKFSKDILKAWQNIFVIPHSIDTTFFKPLPATNYYLDGDIKLLTVARFHRYKGLTYLIKALNMLLEEDNSIYLNLLGRGPEEQKLRHLVDRLNLKNNVKFIREVVPDYKMPYIYSECDLYVQPSIIEPFGIAVVEAMACGKPVIGTKTGGMLDTIIHGKTGFLVPPGDTGALHKSIARMVNNKKVLKKMGRNARKEALKYDWKIITQKYLSAILPIISK